MKQARSLGLAAVFAATILLAACGETESGTLSPGDDSTSAGTQPPSEPSQADPGDPDGQAPPVENPLDPELLLSEPCDLLTESQRDELGITDGTQSTGSISDEEVCSWKQEAESANNIYISALPDTPDGLSTIYANRESGDHFEPVTIDGYPAVFAAKQGTASDDMCKLFVGITDETVASVDSSFLKPQDSEDLCEYAHDAAEAMIDTLQD